MGISQNNFLSQLIIITEPVIEEKIMMNNMNLSHLSSAEGSRAIPPAIKTRNQLRISPGWAHGFWRGVTLSFLLSSPYLLFQPIMGQLL